MSSKAALVTKTINQLIVLDSSKLKSGSSSGVLLRKIPASATIATGSATLTVSQMSSGTLVQTPAANSTLTLPSAAALVAAFDGTSVGDAFDFKVINLAAATYNTVIAVPASGTLVGTATVAPVTSGRFTVRFTNVTSGSEAYTVTCA